MYCVKEKDGKFLTGFSQQTSMDGIGIANVLACPEFNYTSSQLEEVLIADEDFEKLIEADKTYVDKRRIKYPDIGDQLDALYHAGVFPEDMAEKIKAVKDEFPKE